MDLNKLTIKAQEALQHAHEHALSNTHAAIENAHILKGIFETDDTVLPYILKKHGANAAAIAQALNAILAGYAKVQGSNLQLSRNASETISKAQQIMTNMKDEFTTVEHLILALLETKDQTAQLLKDNGLTAKQVMAVIEELRNGERVTSASQESTYHSLDKFAINLNKRASAGKLDPVIGRDDEIRRVIQILSRRTKNNPILIGEPGVGKTAIAEGIAHRIISGDVPDNLQSKTIYSLDMGALIAGAKYKGEFEERLKSVVKEVISANGEIVLFIDEIHTLVGAGGGEGAMDAANILKPALARGELRAVGATTLNEYQKYFEKDKALERRFQKVMVQEPDRDAAISILRGIKEKYENHHKILIKDEAIIAAVELSTRYINDRYLPDKAIDLMDEAASKLRMEMNSKPQDLDELDRKIMQLEIERAAIKRENDKKKLTILSEELANLSEKRQEMQARWQSEKDLVEGMQSAKEAMEQLKFEADQAERDGDFAKVAEIRYGKIKEAEEKIAKLKEQAAISSQVGKMIKEEVDAEEIADVVSRWTGIPLKKMLESDKHKLLHLEDELHERVVGQEEAVSAVADAVRRSRSGLQDEKKPIGSFIFLGTTGVGKTELAKSLSDYLFNDENAMTRIDMSEYQERHSVSRLVGPPPGYVGYDEGGQLTEAVRRKPYSVILLDEIEKAHPDVFNTLLQVLDDGRLTDNKGRLVNFKNSIIIMTSNIGSDIIQSNYDDVKDADDANLFDATKSEVLEALKQAVRPEFLNRIDEVIMFKPLSRKDVKSIVNIQIKGIQKRLAEKNIRLKVSDEAMAWLSERGYSPQFGARPIKRLLQKEVMNQLSKQLIAGDIDHSKPLVMDVFENQVVFRKPINEVEEM
ncbi:MAG: ATP-dependent Clp protease ATP-binding subunit ClpB [Flavobacteriales bacterium]|jgi:ATP-dependent Clp protease ATP-binding subunit ClpB